MNKSEQILFNITFNIRLAYLLRLRSGELNTDITFIEFFVGWIRHRCDVDGAFTQSEKSELTKTLSPKSNACANKSKELFNKIQAFAITAHLSDGVNDNERIKKLMDKFELQGGLSLYKSDLDVKINFKKLHGGCIVISEREVGLIEDNDGYIPDSGVTFNVYSFDREAFFALSSLIRSYGFSIIESSGYVKKNYSYIKISSSAKAPLQVQLKALGAEIYNGTDSPKQLAKGDWLSTH